MSNLRRLAIGVEYDGTNYNGWQYQPHAPSVQESLGCLPGNQEGQLAGSSCNTAVGVKMEESEQSGASG